MNRSKVSKMSNKTVLVARADRLARMPVRLRISNVEIAGLVPHPPAQLAKLSLSDSLLMGKLADSSIFQEFQRAFEDATCLPLTLRTVESWQLAHVQSRWQNGFCSLMAGAGRSCSACLQMQQNVCDAVAEVACTRNCVFGLGETAVAVRTGDKIIGFLQTGQVFFKPPSGRQTHRALKQIKDWGLDFDLREVRRLYQETPVMRRIEYDAAIRLLQFFANQLGPIASQLLLMHRTAEPEQISRARNFILDRYRQNLPLAEVALHAGMSACYFCKMFKKVTGMNFTKYLTRVRVEAAERLLMNLNYRVTEVAYEVGFQSLTHFNRAFRTIAGKSPTEYRKCLLKG